MGNERRNGALGLGLGLLVVICQVVAANMKQHVSCGIKLGVGLNDEVWNEKCMRNSHISV
jgi:hypothetical protein